ncbi:MAG: DUF4249 family protein [Bacteroidales bacterium]|nr:DUF4249 family protein [Bacteroidales bacterium]
MKTIIYILFVAVLMFAACEKDYPLSSIGNTEGVLCLNGYLYADTTDNTIILTTTGENYPAAAKDAKIDFYVNGALKESLAAKDTEDGKTYHLHTVFHPGDNVRLEASAGGKSVWMEDVAPQMLDDLDVVITPMLDKPFTNNDGDSETGNFISINATFSDNPDMDDFYSIDVEMYDSTIYYVDYVYSWDNEIILDSVLVRSEEWEGHIYNDYKYKCYSLGGDKPDEYYREDYDLIYGDEVILKDDILSTPSIDFSSENPFEQEGMYKMRNHFHIFSDIRFAGNKCDMSVVKKGYVGYDTYPCHEKDLSDSVYVPEWFTAATVLIDCLSESCYRYLKMANGIVMGYYRDYDALIDPIKMPSNVHGGSGTIGIITRNSKRIVLYDHYRPKPVYAPERRW